jgi:Ca2+-binding EF-hand superfamily protein
VCDTISVVVCFLIVLFIPTKPLGEIARRAMLVSKLSKAQRKEFEAVFDMVDVTKKGRISLLEMRKFMETARETKTDTELLRIMHRANPSYDFSNTVTMTQKEFLGVMAEAEFYNLLADTFRELDREETGYVRAGDLSEVLGGVQELIADEKKINIIDAEGTSSLFYVI